MPKGVYPRLAASDRFDAWIEHVDDHYLWTGALNGVGYANFWFEGRYIGAHVYAWMRLHGPLAPGEVLRHLCRYRHCVNPEHLQAGTKGDNNRDRQRDGTQTRGSAHHSSKITEDQVREAKRLRDLGVTWARIGRDFSIDAGTIADAVRHRHGVWRHVEFDD